MPGNEGVSIKNQGVRADNQPFETGFSVAELMELEHLQQNINIHIFSGCNRRQNTLKSIKIN